MSWRSRDWISNVGQFRTSSCVKKTPDCSNRWWNATFKKKNCKLGGKESRASSTGSNKTSFRPILSQSLLRKQQERWDGYESK